MFEFLAEKIWLWIIITLVNMGLVLGVVILCLRNQFEERLEKILIIPLLLTALCSIIIFIIAAFCKAWGM